MKIDLVHPKGSVQAAKALDMLLGGTTGQGDIQNIAISCLKAYIGQPFKPYSPDQLKEFAEDIRRNGILSPVIVRPTEGVDYTILSGHNRTAAAKIAGLHEIPCIVMDVDDATADLILVNSNLNQRQKLLPSEKAFAYKMQLEAIEKQGATNCRKTAAVASANDENRRQIQRYIRLTLLIPEFLELVDNEKLPVMAGVNLSYMSTENQRRLFKYLKTEDIRLCLKQSEQIKETAARELIDCDYLNNLFAGKQPAEKKISINYGRIQKYFPAGVSKQQIQETIIQALDQYYCNPG